MNAGSVIPTRRMLTVVVTRSKEGRRGSRRQVRTQHNSRQQSFDFLARSDPTSMHSFDHVG